MKIALWQTQPVHDPDEALDALNRVAGDAVAKGAQLLVTPELYLGGYNVGAARIQELASLGNTLISGLASMASTHRLNIVCGLALDGEHRPCNTAIAIDNNGQELSRYHKTHLFGDVDAAQFDRGAKAGEVFLINNWRVGLAICYDIEFPELARDLASKGATLIITPTANMQEFNSISERVVPCRAEENGVFVAYANYVGAEPPFTYGGSSCICGPDGNDIARAPANQAALLIAELNPQAIDDVRAQQHYLADRRTDLYNNTSGNEA